MPEERKHTIVGAITGPDQEPIAGARVRARGSIVDPRISRQIEADLGESTTDRDGRYLIEAFVPETFLARVRRAHLWIEVATREGVEARSEPTTMDGDRIDIDLRVAAPRLDDERRVHGEIRDAVGVLLADVVVEAFDRDLRAEQSLGRSVTDGGRYEIRYSAKQFRRAEKDYADLVVGVTDASGSVIARTPVHYNAPGDARIDIAVGGRAYAGPSIWESMNGALLPLLEDLSPVDLREDEEHLDITFLSGETGYTMLELAAWIAAWRIAERTARDESLRGGHDPVAAEAAFAFLHTGEPSLFRPEMLEDVKYPERRLLMEDALLRDLSAILPDRQRQILAAAVKANVVSSAVLAQEKGLLGTLEQIRLRLARDKSIGGGKSTIGQLLDAVSVDRGAQDSVIAAIENHHGPLRTLWPELEATASLPRETITRVRTGVELGALTRNHVPLVAALTRRVLDGELTSRALAQFSSAQWQELFRSEGPDGAVIGVPDNIDGETTEQKQATFATILEKQFERAYPTAALAGRIARTPDAGDHLTKDVAGFLDAHPDFQLDRVRIDQYFEERKIDRGDGQLTQDLAAVQRVFALSPRFDSTRALLTHGVKSAQQVYYLGQGQLRGMLADTPVSPIEARAIYRRAETVYAHSLVLFGEFNVALNGPLPSGVPQSAETTSDDVRAKIEALPNLRSLFGSLDYCACTECQSVYSPAAHFVDVLRFLGDRSTHGTAANAGKSVLEVLLQRRPDLGDVELSCANTNTTLPYIDLTNEILEDVVAPPAPLPLPPAVAALLVEGRATPALRAELLAAGVSLGEDAHVYAADSRGDRRVRDDSASYRIVADGAGTALARSRQTGVTAQEARSAPEHVNSEAYATLADAVFPFTMPFDLAFTQTQIYLARLGVAHDTVRRLFGAAPTPADIASAQLGLDATTRQLVTSTLSGRNPWDYWGLAQTGNALPHPDMPTDPTAVVAGTWLEVLTRVSVMLHRTGLGYRQLLGVLATRFVDPGRVTAIVPPAGADPSTCDVSVMTISGLDADLLERLHRFVRMWRRTDLSISDLDRFLAPRALDDDAIVQLAALLRLRGRTARPFAELVAVFAGLEDRGYIDHDDDGGAVDTSIYERVFRARPVLATAPFPRELAQLSGSVGDWTLGLLAALRISETDLGLVLAGLGETSASALTRDVLGRLWRVAAFARALRVSVPQLLDFARVTSKDPFASPSSGDEFADVVDAIGASGFSLPGLDYLLEHRFAEASGVALDERSIIVFLDATRRRLADAAQAMRRQAGESSEAYVTARLGQLPSLSDDAALTTATAIVDGSWTGPDAERDALIAEYLAPVLTDVSEAQSELAALPLGQSPAERQKRVDARFAYVAPLLESFLAMSAVEGHARQQAAALLGLGEPTADLVADAIRVSGTSLADLLRDPAFIETRPDGSFATGVSAADLPVLHAALVRAHKAALVIDRLGMTHAEAAWWLEGSRARALGWIDPADLAEDGATPIDFERWSAMHRLFAWRADLRPSGVTVLDVLDTVLDPTSPSAASLAALGRVAGWAEDDLRALATQYGWLGGAADTVKTELARPGEVLRVAEAMAALALLGVSAERAGTWAAARPSAVIAAEVTRALKSRYDEKQWLEVNQSIQDELRERRRDVLVDWLVAHPDAAAGQTWTDADGLYAHYLIDVETNAVVLTSRLKQATASAALFAQRVLLGLETDILASTVVDPKWKQWEWMRRQQIWVANRKVFLYPENWLEPELRDEKSAFFLELEGFLRQHEVTAASAEEALRAYLTKLEKVSNLEIRAMNEERIGDEQVMHVVGRTRSSKGAEYFYRSRINRARWTAWRPVDVEISADHLVIGMHNKRLYLMWPQFLEKAEDPNTLRTPAENSTFAVEPPRKYWEVRMFWSELRDAVWTPKVLSDSVVRLPFTYNGGNPMNVAFRVRLAPQILARVFATPDPLTSAPISEEAFEKLGTQVSAIRNGLVEYLVVPPASYSSGNLIRQSTNELYFYYSSIVEWTKAHQLSPTQGAQTIRVLRNAPDGRTVIDSAAFGFAPHGSVFVWDDSRSYFVDYAHRTESGYVSQQLHTWAVSQFTFFPHYHPFVELFTKELNIWGIPGLLNRRIQIAPHEIPGAPAPFDFAAYQPESTVTAPHPKEEVDFSYAGAYSPYNWELFFHVPMYIAGRLAANQKFEEALSYYNYIFDPTSTDTATADPDTPQQKFWITKPFYETTRADYHKQRIESIMSAIARGDVELRAQVAEWRQHPFNPHLIARMRTVAYQKNVLIKYLETVIAWADELFGHDTIESINEATQLYMLASAVLGQRPRSVQRTESVPVRTFYQLFAEGIDDFGNVLIDIENLLPPASTPDAPAPQGPEMPRLELLYFGIPHNDKLIGLWNTVDDRLYKIRNSLNLAGVLRQLPLFDPPIDPGILVKAAAAGLDVAAVLNDLNGPLPPLRFSAMMEKARTACDAVVSLGAEVLSALEKRDAERFAAVRSSHEQSAMDVLRDVRSGEIADATTSLEAVRLGKTLVEVRRDHFHRLVDDGWSAGEITAMALSGASLGLEAAVAVGYVLSGGLKLIPDFVAGAAGFGGTPHVTATMGGQSIGNSAEMAVATLRSIATAFDKGASMASVVAGYARRAQDWQHQAQLAGTEIPVVDKQIRSAELKLQIAEHNLRHHDTQRDHMTVQDAFLHTKFTNDQLYDWMIDQLAAVYFQSHQLAYDLAKRAERCFRYELGIESSSYIGSGHWDSLRKGLLAGQRLASDLRRMDAAYHDLNRREYEITKHFALSQLDPVALLQFTRNGECFFDLPEVAYDLDNPGHFFRRISSVSLSIPSVVGPYGSVSCTLTLVANSMRTDASLGASGSYGRDTANADPRFRDGAASIQSIATSTGADDAGLFQVRFDDERYLPFEGAGAISSWHLRLNPPVAQFDPQSISDVVVNVRYTAREGGAALRAAATQDFAATLNGAVLAAGRAGLYRVIDLKRELPTEFHRFLHPASPADEQVLAIGDLSARLPYFTRAFPDKQVRSVEVVAKTRSGGIFEVALAPLADLLTLSPDPTYTGLHRAAKDLAGAEAPISGWSLRLREQGAADYASLPADEITELFLIVGYTVGGA